MKYSADLATKAIEFALSKNSVRAVLGPIDSRPYTTIKQVSSKVTSAQAHSVTLEIIFDYIALEGGDAEVQDIHILVNWFQHIGFTLGDITVVGDIVTPKTPNP